MFSSTRKKKVTAIMLLTMMIMALGASAAMATRADKVTICHVPPGNEGNPQTLEVGAAGAANHLANHDDDYLGPCKDDGGEDPGEDPGEDDGDECETISIEIDGIEIDICVLVDVDIDLHELLDVLHLLHGVNPHDRLEWLEGRLDLGDRVERLRGKVDLYDLFAKLHWLKHEAVPGLLGFVGGTVFDLLDHDYDGDGNGGGSTGVCVGGINVCNNANDVLDAFGYGGGNQGVCAGGINVCNNANDLVDAFYYGGGNQGKCEGGINVCNNANDLVDVFSYGGGNQGECEGGINVCNNANDLLNLHEIGDVLYLIDLF